MSAGTLTLTNNSAAVAGSGTAFTTELAAGDFIVVTVGGVPYTLPVKSVESGTALTLVSNYTGPTQSGAAWSAVPRVALNMVTAALVAQSAEALRGLNYDKQNWQQVYSGAGSITVKLPDGTTFTGPSWKYLSDNMATKSGGAVPVNQGGTGSTTESGARTNLGLGNSATRDVGTAAGTVAAGNDARFNTIDQKTGGAVNGSITSYTQPSVTEGAVGGLIRSLLRWANGTDAAVAALYAQMAADGSLSGNIQVANASSGTTWSFMKSTGNAVAPGAWVPNSDGRLKDGVSRIEDPLSKMEMLKGCSWTRKDTGQWGIGFIAQDVKKIFPQAVTEGGDRQLPDGTMVEGVLSPDTYGVAAALHHEAILALMNELSELREEVNALKSE
ncbi:tail fiber domain-containing protein [Citrobacter freundii]|uniref:tail fiber domain-containing protein n=1 Tax=Citrobacter freundii TaxID=546 RepID=UPI0008026212|nr:tail fiber domain-containing protein [Citrobacter freundii]